MVQGFLGWPCSKECVLGGVTVGKETRGEKALARALRWVQGLLPLPSLHLIQCTK